MFGAAAARAEKQGSDGIVALVNDDTILASKP